MEASTRVDFFISYTQVDQAWAEWIAWQLEDAGCTTRFQAWDFRPGANFVLELQEAARDCERTIAVLSEAYLASAFAQPEWAAAFAQDPTGQTRRLVPVRVRPCELAGLLAQVVHVDLTDCVAPEEARRRLLDGVARVRSKPDVEPAFPARHADGAPVFPGSGPATWNAPAPSRSFSGREALIASVAEQFAHERARPAVQVLHGLGGVGKTQIAARFAAAHRDDYDVVWWVQADNEAIREDGLAQLAGALGLAPGGQQDKAMIDAAIAALFGWLRQHDRWLLVLDDAPDPVVVEDVLPDDGGGHVLVTSRAASGWRGIATPVAVERWVRAESTAFLAQRTGHDDGADADRLAAALGDLPLALEQAGAYLDVLGLDCAAYLERMDAHAATLLEQRAPRGYGASVATTWSLAFEQLAGDGDTRRLLDACSALAPEPIPDAVLEALIPDVLRRDRAVEAALRYSLVTTRGRALVMHPLVQQVAQLRLSDDERAAATLAALEAVAAAFPQNSMLAESWPSCLALLPHVARLGRGGMGSEANACYWTLIERLAVFHGARGEYDFALPLLEHLADALETAPSVDAGRLIQPWSQIGFILGEIGELDAAADYIGRALALAERTWEPSDPKLGALLDGAGNLCDSRGDPAGAVWYRERALEIYERTEANPLHVAGALSNLGISCLMLRRLEEAREHLEHAVAVLEELDAPHPVLYANALGGLADVSDAEGDFEAALPLHERALTLLERALGPENLLVAGTRVSLAWTLAGLEEWDRARDELSRAAEQIERALPEHHPDVIRLRRASAIAAFATGDPRAALEQLEDAIAHTSEFAFDERRFQLIWQIWIEEELGRTDEADFHREDLLALSRSEWPDPDLDLDD
jgi:tetratricopeptide (TPR) repeat protein